MHTFQEIGVVDDVDHREVALRVLVRRRVDEGGRVGRVLEQGAERARRVERQLDAAGRLASVNLTQPEFVVEHRFPECARLRLAALRHKNDFSLLIDPERNVPDIVQAIGRVSAPTADRLSLLLASGAARAQKQANTYIVSLWST